MKTHMQICLGLIIVFITPGFFCLTAPLPRGERPREKSHLTGFISYIVDLAFSPDGQLLASAGADGTARLWDIVNSKSTAVFKHPVPDGGAHAFVSSVAFSPDGSTLASSADGTLRLWDITKGINTLSLANTGSAHVLFSSDGRSLVSPEGGRRLIWNTETNKEQPILPDANLHAPIIAFDPKGKLLIAGIENDIRFMNRVFSLWDGKNGKKIMIFKGHTSFLSVLAFTPDGATLASASNDETVRIWDTKTGKTTTTFKEIPGYPCGLAFSPDGKILACGYLYQGRDGLKPQRGAVRLYEIATGKILATLKGSDPGPIGPLAFSPDGRILAAGSDNCIKLWKLPLHYAPED